MFKRFKLRTILLLLLVLLSGIYLLRWPLFGGLIRQRAAEAISSALGVAVDLDDFEGSLLGGIRCRSMRLEARDGRSQLRFLSVADIRVDYDLWRLIAGDLGALSISAADADLAVDLDRPGIRDDSGSSGSGQFALPDHLPAIDILVSRIEIFQGGRALNATGGRLSLDPPDQTGKQRGFLRADRVLASSPDWDELWSDVDVVFVSEKGSLRASLSEPGADDGRLEASLTIDSGEPARASVELDIETTGGSAHIDATARLEREIPVEATIRTSGLDLSRTATELAPFIGRLLPLWGRLDGTIGVTGPLIDPEALAVEVALRVAQGGWLDVEPLDLDLSARLDDGVVAIERCRIGGSDVDLDVSDGLLPLKDWIPLLDSASADFTFRLGRIREWTRLFDLVDVQDSAVLTGASTAGAGRLTEGVLHLAHARFESRTALIRLERALVDRRNDKLHIEVAELEGDLDGREIALTDPLVVDIAAGRVEVAPTRFKAGSGSILVDAEIMHDRSARIHAVLSSADSSLLNLILPAAGYDSRVDWDGLEATLDLSGTVDALRGDLILDIDRFSNDQIVAEDIALRVNLTPQRVEVKRFDCSLVDGGRVNAHFGWDLDQRGLFAEPTAMAGSVDWRDLNLAALRRFGSLVDGAEGRADGSLRVDGPLSALAAMLSVRFSVKKTPAGIVEHLPDGLGRAAWDLALDIEHAEGAIQLKKLDLSTSVGLVTASGRMPLRIDLSGWTWRVETPERLRGEIRGAFDRLDLGAIGVATDLAGIVSGRFECAGPIEFPRGALTATVNDLTYTDFDGHDLFIECRLDEGLLTVPELTLSREERILVAGRLSVDLKDRSAGSLSWPGAESSFDLNLRLEGGDLADFGSLLGGGVAGIASVDIEGKGILADPRVSVELAVEQGRFPLADEETPLPVDLHAQLLFEAETLTIRSLDVETLEGAFLRADGVIPLGIGWHRVAAGELLSVDGPLSGSVESSTIDLARFGQIVPGVRRLGGLLSIDGDLSGSLSAPECIACASLTEGVVRFESRIPSLEEIEMSLRVDRFGIHIDSIDAEMGAGPVHVEGLVAFDDFKPASLDLRLKGDHVLLSRGRGLRVRGDLDLVLDGPVESPRLSGEVALSETRFVRHIPLIPGKGPPSVDDRFQPFSLTDPHLADVVLDVCLVTRTEKAVVVDNNLLGGELLLDMSLKGTGKDPFFQGTATFNEMLIKFPNSRFQVDAGRLSFTERDPYMPHIELSARGRRQSYDISFTAWGPLNDPEITFNTIPPLPEEDVLVLVTTGMVPDSFREKGVENEALKQVGAYLGMELFQNYFGSETTESRESIGDRVELSIGTEVGGDGTDNVVIEYRIQGPWSLQVERDIYADMNLGLVYRIRFR